MVRDCQARKVNTVHGVCNYTLFEHVPFLCSLTFFVIYGTGVLLYVFPWLRHEVEGKKRKKKMCCRYAPAQVVRTHTHTRTEFYMQSAQSASRQRKLSVIPVLRVVQRVKLSQQTLFQHRVRILAALWAMQLLRYVQLMLRVQVKCDSIECKKCKSTFVIWGL